MLKIGHINFKLHLLIVGALCWAGIASAETIYVNVNSLNTVQNGTSWATAFVSLQDALVQAASSPGQSDIWVAKGTYFPTAVYTPSGIAGGECINLPANPGFTCTALQLPNLITFNLPDQVAIYGGFNGTERSFSKRNPQQNITILSGAATSWHVVTIGNDVAKTGVTATLDGLTISEGNAQGPTAAVPAGFVLFGPFVYDHASGGGVYAAFSSNVTINNVIFTNDVAKSEGGGFYSNSSNVRISNSQFFGNTAGVEGGGIEILNTFETVPHFAIIEGSSFHGNNAGNFGAAITTQAMAQNSGTYCEIRSCNFQYNYAQLGAAVAIDSQRTSVSNSTFTDNIAAVAGGALSTSNIVNTLTSGLNHLPFTPYTTTISNSDFRRNLAQGNVALHDTLEGGLAAGVDFPLGGGAITTYINGYLKVDKSNFCDNTAQNSDGGAIINGRAAVSNFAGLGISANIAQTTVTNSTFRNNTSLTENGGAIASLPSTYFATPAASVTFLEVLRSNFTQNIAGLNGGGIYLNTSTAVLKGNTYRSNRAAIGNSIYAINSIINGDARTPYIKD